ncbi:MAG: hypothetical protein JSR46_00880 [Verrucomicrobia bacterium]|nr:hypothetical protein [Verrucomicrobiota bacterium]
MSDVTVAPSGSSGIFPQPTASKKEQLYLPIPVQLFGADLVETAGRTLLSEKVVKPVSLLGYYGFSAVGGLGSLIEGVVNLIINEDIAETVTDFGQIAVEERFREAGQNQEVIAGVAQTAVSWIPYATQGIQTIGSALLKNMQAAVAHVCAGKSAFDYGARIFCPIIRGLVRTPVHLLITLPARDMTEAFRVASENPAEAQEIFVRAADLMRGKAWRAEYATQRFFNRAAIYADQEGEEVEETRLSPALTLDEFKAMTPEERESVCFIVHQSAKKLGLTQRQRHSQQALLKKYTHRETKNCDASLQKIVTYYNELSDRDINKLTPHQFESLSPSEKIRVVQLVKEYAVTASQRLQLRQYQKALEEGVPLPDEKKVRQLVLDKFNTLSASEQSSILDISRGEFSAFSHDEQLALLDFLITKVSKRESPNVENDLQRLQTISGRLHSNLFCSAKDLKKITSCFKTYLSGQEKSALRRLLHEQVIVQNGTSEQLQAGIKELEEKIRNKHSEIDAKGTEASREDLLGMAELKESLHYLQELQNTTEIESAAALLPQGAEPGIAKQKYGEKIGAQVQTEGYLYKAFDTAGAVGEYGIWGAGKAMSKTLEGIGAVFTPKAVHAALQGTAFWLENCQWLAQAAGWAVGLKLSPTVEKLASRLVQASDITIDSLIKAEEQAVGVFSKLAELEKGSWDTYVLPLLKKMKDIDEKRPLAEQVEAFQKKLDLLKADYMEEGRVLQTQSKIVKMNMEALSAQFQEVIEQYHHNQSDGHIIHFSYEHIFRTVKEQNPELPTDSHQFFTKLFQQMEQTCIDFVSDIDKAIPREGSWWWPTPTMELPEKELTNVMQMTPSLSVTDVINEMTAIAGSQAKVQKSLASAQEAQQELLDMQKTWAGWAAVHAGPSQESITSIEKIGKALETTCKAAITGTSTVQKVAGVQLEFARKQANLFTNYGVLKNSAFELAGAGLDYMNGRLAMKILTRFTARTLRRFSPHIEAYAQPFWYGLARGVEFSGEASGKAVRTGLQGIGGVVQETVNAAIRGEHFLTTGETYVDPLRIAKYRKLTKNEQAHVQYLVLRSPNTEAIKEKLAFELDDQNRVAELLLQGFDALDEEEKMMQSPASVSSMDRKMQRRLVAIIQEYEQLTFEEASDPAVIAKKFNDLAEKERKELSRISVDEFEQLAPDEQQDILFAVMNRGARAEKELLNRQIGDFWKSQEVGLNRKELKKILALFSEMSDREKKILTPAKLKEMGLAKAVDLLSILENYGKIYLLDPQKAAVVRTLHSSSSSLAIKKEQEKALVILATLYNATLTPVQQGQLARLSQREMSQLTPKERLELTEFLKCGPELPDEDVRMMFNSLPAAQKSDWRQMMQSGRQALENLKVDIKTEMDSDTRALRKLSKQMKTLTRQYSEAATLETKAALDVELKEIKRQIDDLQNGIKEWDRALEQLKNGKPITSAKVEEKKMDAGMQQMVEALAKGEEATAEALADFQLQPLLNQPNKEIVKGYLDLLQNMQAQPQKNELHKKVLQKQIEAIEKALPVVVAEPERAAEPSVKEVVTPPARRKTVEKQAAPEVAGAFFGFLRGIASIFTGFGRWFSSLFTTKKPEDKD